MPRGFESLHVVLALTRGTMRVLTPVVEITALPMFHPRQDLALRGPVALQFIGADDPWDVLTPFEQRAEELLRCPLVAPALHQNIEDIIVLVHRSPQGMAVTINGEKYLIQVPLVTRPRAPVAELIGVVY